MRDSVTLQSLYSVVASSAAQMVVRVASKYEVVWLGLSVTECIAHLQNLGFVIVRTWLTH